MFIYEDFLRKIFCNKGAYFVSTTRKTRSSNYTFIRSRASSIIELCIFSTESTERKYGEWTMKLQRKFVVSMFNISETFKLGVSIESTIFFICSNIELDCSDVEYQIRDFWNNQIWFFVNMNTAYSIQHTVNAVLLGSQFHWWPTAVHYYFFFLFGNFLSSRSWGSLQNCIHTIFENCLYAEHTSKISVIVENARH